MVISVSSSSFLGQYTLHRGYRLYHHRRAQLHPSCASDEAPDESHCLMSSGVGSPATMRRSLSNISRCQFPSNNSSPCHCKSDWSRTCYQYLFGTNSNWCYVSRRPLCPIIGTSKTQYDSRKQKKCDQRKLVDLKVREAHSDVSFVAS